MSDPVKHSSRAETTLLSPLQKGGSRPTPHKQKGLAVYVSNGMARQTQEEAVKKFRKDNPKLFYDTMASIVDFYERASEAYRGFLCQLYWRQTLDDAELLAVGKIHAAINVGDMAISIVDVGCEPASDKAVETNCERLASLLPSVKAEFWGGTQDEDGKVEFLLPRHCAVGRCTNEKSFSKVVGIMPPQGFCLEVGYLSASKFWNNLAMGLPMARWPYGSRYLYCVSDAYVGTATDGFWDLVAKCPDTISECVSLHDSLIKF